MKKFNLLIIAIAIALTLLALMLWPKKQVKEPDFIINHSEIKR